MDESLFIGRDAELEQLKSLLLDGAKGKGSIVYIEGEAGSGKSSLLEKMQAQAKQIEQLENAYFVYGYCYEGAGSENAYQPFVEILNAILKPDVKSKDVAKLVLTIIKETAPDWLNIIPGVGPAVNAGIKTATTVGQLMLNSDEKDIHPVNLPAQYVNTLAKISSNYHPLILIIEDAHWIDNSSSDLLMRISHDIQKTPLIIILTYRPDYLPETHPLKNTQRELNAKGIAQVITLTNLSEDQIQKYVQGRFGSTLNPQLSAWLAHLCNGNPLFVTQYLNLLEQTHIIRPDGEAYILDGSISCFEGEWELSDNIPIPKTVEGVLKQRIDRLVETDQKMLQQAAVQGENFMSTILSELLDVKEIDLLPRLRNLVEEYHLIRYGSGADDWAEDSSDVYTFEHALMQQAFYYTLSPREQVLYHRKVAEILERALKNSANKPRKLVIEVAHHYDLGNAYQLAANYYLMAAQSSYASGAFVETMQLCQRALDKAHQIKDCTVDDDRLRAEIIQLLLFSSEIRWRGKYGQGRISLDQLVDEAETAATSTGDLALIAQIKFLKGQLIVVQKDFPEAIAEMQEALKIAQQSGDPFIEFIIMSRLGHESAGQNLEAGLDMLLKANDLYETRLRNSPPAGLNPVLLSRAFYRLQSLIGVARFDLGNFGEAIKWLTGSVEGLKQQKAMDYLVAPYNFLAQVYIASGLFEDAEANLRKAIDLFKDDKEPNAWNGYNLGLLGKLYLEWGRVEDAAGPLIAGWDQTQQTWYMAMAPLVRNYYAELLMSANYSKCDEAEAECLLLETVDETKLTAAHRSAIAALSLLSKLKLQKGQINDAVDYSTQAFEYLKKMGLKMPALRTEEVLFNHYRALDAASRGSEAQGYLAQANEIIQQKSATFQNAGYQRSFLERVPLNREIASAMKNPSPGGAGTAPQAGGSPPPIV